MKTNCLLMLYNFVLVYRDEEPETPATPFEILEDRGISDSSAITETSTSYYHLMTVAAAVGLIASLMLIGIGLMMSKRADKRSERKQELIFKIVTSVGIFAFVYLINVLFSIAMAF